jgi:hypothetical protein
MRKVGGPPAFGGPLKIARMAFAVYDDSLSRAMPVAVVLGSMHGGVRESVWSGPVLIASRVASQATIWRNEALTQRSDIGIL